jgi:hypothetical protein
MHGGVTTTADRPNAARLRHGEQSAFIRKSVVRELLKGASPFSDEAVRKKLIELNLLDRRVRRKEIGAAVDLDVALRLDDADRRDVETLLKAEQVEHQAEGIGQVQIIAPNVTLAISPVRGPKGLTELLTLPDGRHLLREDGGVWREARATTTGEGAEVWLPALDAAQ